MGPVVPATVLDQAGTLVGPSALLMTHSSLVAGAVLGLLPWSGPDVVQQKASKSKGLPAAHMMAFRGLRYTGTQHVRVPRTLSARTQQVPGPRPASR